jgi:chaperonin GroES
MPFSMKPLSDWIVLAMIADDQGMMAGSLYVPDTVAGKLPRRCRVIAAGPGRMREDGSVEPMPVGVGDVVMPSPHNSLHVIYGGVEMILIHASQLIAVIVHEPETTVEDVLGRHVN